MSGKAEHQISNAIEQIQVALYIIDDTETVIYSILKDMGILKKEHTFNCEWESDGCSVELIHYCQGGRDTEFAVSFCVEQLATSETIQRAIVEKDRKQKEEQAKAEFGEGFF